MGRPSATTTRMWWLLSATTLLPRPHPPPGSGANKILGQLGGDEIGLRQLQRAEPLDAVLVDGLWVPTLPEMIRVKAFVLSDRRAVRERESAALL